MALGIAYKYSLGPRDEVTTAIGEHFIRINLGSGKIFRDDPVAFLTPDFLEDSRKAQEFLSISYAPDHRCLVQLPPGTPLIDNQGKSCSVTDLAPRVWPAFGHAGGGHEFLLHGARTSLVCSPQPFLQGPTGGWKDPFHQDDVQSFTQDELVRIVRRRPILAILMGFEERKVEVLNLKVVPSGLVFQWTARDLRYAVSVAYREEVAGTAVRLWGDIWREGYTHDPIATDFPSGERPSLHDSPLGPSAVFVRFGWGPISTEFWLPFVSPRRVTRAANFVPRISQVIAKEFANHLAGLVTLGVSIQNDPPTDVSWSQPSPPV